MRTLFIQLCVASCASCIFSAGCTRPGPVPVPVPDPPAKDAAQSRFLKVQDVSTITSLEQGWDDKEANWFYNIDQGSQLFPYDWFLNLELSDSEDLFRNETHIRKLGYLSRSASADNPDGLPIGFAKNQGRDREWVGLNCAACHTSQINYKGQGCVIDGAPALSDLGMLLTSLSAALKQTIDHSPKFDRFAGKILGDTASESDRTRLREDMVSMLEIRNDYVKRNLPADLKFEHGYARIDAFGAILNEVSVRFLEIPDNEQVCNAPVSIPFLWDTPQHDFVQWPGSAPNGIVGSLARNTGEVLGVFGNLEVPEEAPILPGYSSSVEINNLRKIEEAVTELWSPQWPSVFPEVDQALADKGKGLFGQYCNACHADINRTDPNRKIIASMDDVGSDPMMFNNFARRIVKTGRLEGTHMDFNPLGEKFGPSASGKSVLVHEVIGAILGSWREAPPDQIQEHRDAVVKIAADVPKPKYKGRPLNGIWATAPFLHNGSVPNMYQLLLPAADRTKEFWVGSREFDPKDVGFISTEASGLFRFDTSVPGNTNVGHEYGTGVSEDDGGDGLPALEDEQRRQLVEYIKTL